MQIKQVWTFVAGVLFAVGLAISGMTMPSKVINFLDVFGHWDPSLAFVMIGAISVYSIIFHFVKPSMKKPLYAEQFKIPTRVNIDLPMIFGSALFGAGWGLGGFCPGPALASAFLFDSRVLVFIAAMSVGMYIAFVVQPHIPRRYYRND